MLVPCMDHPGTAVMHIPPRRRFLAAGIAGLALSAGRPLTAAEPAAADRYRAAALQVVRDAISVDIHSHAGRVLLARPGQPQRPLEALAEPMRQGGQTAICLSMVADTPVVGVTADRRLAAHREPEPGELHAWSGQAFARLRVLMREQGLAQVTGAAALRAAKAAGQPAAIVAAEGADFLEGAIGRLEEAHAAYGLRHLQLTHYRVNELGDIQTEPPVHGGLTAFGVEVIRRCNRLGIVVDIAHGTLDLVKKAAEVSDRPLVLSHTSLSERPQPRSRRIGREHARIVAGTGGVIGVWPPSLHFADLPAYARGIARMAEVAGAEHVGIGSDMLGLLSASAFPSYRRLPDLVAHLLETGFSPEEAGKIIGGNYLRVFERTAT